MTLRELNDWCKAHGVPDDKHLSSKHALHHIGAVRYDLTTGEIVLLDAKQVADRVFDVVANCRCTSIKAREVLRDTNWNISLAIVTVLREKNGRQDRNQDQDRPEENCPEDAEGHSEEGRKVLEGRKPEGHVEAFRPTPDN